MSESNDVTRLINNYAACIEKLLQGRTEKEKKLCFPFPKGTEHDVVGSALTSLVLHSYPTRNL